MSTNHIFIICALIVGGVFSGILSMFGLPQSIMGWAVTDGSLAIMLFASYLLIVTAAGSSKPKLR